MKDYGELWDDYSIEFNSKLVDCNGDWSKLDKAALKKHIE